MALSHHTIVEDHMIRPGNLNKTCAVAFAEGLGFQAFLDEEDGDWYALLDDDSDYWVDGDLKDGCPEVDMFNLTPFRYQNMCALQPRKIIENKES